MNKLQEALSGWDLIYTGGPLMIPLLVCSVFAFGIITEKFITLTRASTNTVPFKKKIFELLNSNKLREALQLCEENKSPTAHLLKAGIIKFGCSQDEIKNNIEDAALLEIPRLELRLNALCTIAYISPLIGMLGTLTELILYFKNLQTHAASLNPIATSDLAGSIAQSLLTTVIGLAIAIITYVAYHFFVNRINELVIDMEKSSTELINFMSQTNEIAS